MAHAKPCFKSSLFVQTTREPRRWRSLGECQEVLMETESREPLWPIQRATFTMRGPRPRLWKTVRLLNFRWNASEGFKQHFRARAYEISGSLMDGVSREERWTLCLQIEQSRRKKPRPLPATHRPAEPLGLCPTCGRGSPDEEADRDNDQARDE